MEYLGAKAKTLVNESPQFFEKKGKVKDHEIKVKMKEGATISQQKERRIPIRMQKAVDTEIKKRPKENTAT